MAKWHLPAQTAAVIDTNTPEVREILFDLTNFRARIGDGTTAGGKALAFQSDLDGLISTAMSPVVTASTALLGFVALGVPTSFATALAGLGSGDSLTDVIEALTIDVYGDARWASLADPTVFEGAVTGPSFTATLANDNATIRALRTGTTTVDARMRAGATQAQFGSWTNHQVEIVVNSAVVATISTAGVWSLSGAFAGPNLTSSVSGADSTVRSVRTGGGDGRIVAKASTVEIGGYGANPVLMMQGAAEAARWDTSKDLDFTNGAGTAKGLRAPIANGEAARYQDIFAVLQFSTGTRTIAATETRYIGGGEISTASTVVAFRAPRAGRIRNLYNKSTGSPGGSDTFTYTVYKNGVATALTAQTPGGASVSSDTSNVVSVAAGDQIDVQCVVSATASPRGHQSTIEMIMA